MAVPSYESIPVPSKIERILNTIVATRTATTKRKSALGNARGPCKGHRTLNGSPRYIQACKKKFGVTEVERFAAFGSSRKWGIFYPSEVSGINGDDNH